MDDDRNPAEAHVELNGKRYVVGQSRMVRLKAMARERRITIEEAWAEVLVSERL